MKRYALIFGLVLAGLLLVGMPADAQKNNKKVANKEAIATKDSTATKDSVDKGSKKKINKAKEDKEEDPWKLLHDKETEIRKLEEKCRALEADIVTLRQQHQNELLTLRQQHEKDMASLHQQYDKELSALQKQHEADVLSLASKDAQLDLLKDIQEQWVLQFVSNVDNNWVNATCSQANVRRKELEKDMAVCTRYAAGIQDQRLTKAQQKLEKVKQNIELYNQMKVLLTQAYNKQNIEALLPLAEALAESKPNDQEVNDLYSRLYSYESIVEILQTDIVAKVDKEFENGKNAASFALAKSAFDEEEENIDDIRSYSIPWVNKWLDAYSDVITRGSENKKNYSDYLKVRDQLPKLNQ